MDEVSPGQRVHRIWRGFWRGEGDVPLLAVSRRVAYDGAGPEPLDTGWMGPGAWHAGAGIAGRLRRC